MIRKLFTTFCVFGVLSISANAAVHGIYVLPKNDKGKESLVEIFEKNGKLYGVGFGTKDGSPNTDVDSKNPDKKMQNRPVRGSVFLEMSCKSDDTCVGKVYSFDKGKVYPIKTTLKNNLLQIKVDVLFGPTLEWKKLNEAESAPFNDKRLDVSTLDTTMPKD